jgi:uncharacterized Zn finger protein (UPF0148 family)
MNAQHSSLHCPVCGDAILVLNRGGLFCARCGEPVAELPAGSGAQDRAELASRRLRARQKVDGAVIRLDEPQSAARTAVQKGTSTPAQPTMKAYRE